MNSETISRHKVNILVEVRLNNIKCAVLTVGGWFDAEGVLGRIRAENPERREAFSRIDQRVARMLMLMPTSAGGQGC